MIRRRRNNEPDKRLDWRDQNMPTLRVFERPSGEIALDPEPPEKEQAFRREMMLISTAPTWRNDPTYNLGSGQRRRRRQ